MTDSEHSNDGKDPEPPYDQMLEEATVAFAHDEQLAPVLDEVRATIARGDEETVRAILAAAYRKAVLNYVADNYTRLENSARKRGVGRAVAGEMVSATLERAENYIAGFDGGVGIFGPPHFVRATPFASTVEPFVWGQLRWAIADHRRTRRNGHGSDDVWQQGAPGKQGDANPAVSAGQPDEAVMDMEADDAIERARLERMVVTRAIRQALTDLDLWSPDLHAMRRTVNLDRVDQLLDPIVRRFLGLVERVPLVRVPPEPTADLVHRVFIEAAHALTDLSTDNRNKFTGSFSAEPGHAVAIAVAVGLEDLKPVPSALGEAHWNLTEMLIELQASQVQLVVERLGRHVTATTEISEERYAANLDWVDQLLDWLADQTSKAALAAIAHKARQALHAPGNKHDSAFQQAAAIAHTEHPHGEQAQDLLALEERLRHIEEEGSQP
jgi:hypothetical protein